MDFLVSTYLIVGPARPMKLLLVGATGLVGRQVLARALADPRVTAVVAPTRQPLPAHPKLQAPRVDFSDLPADVDWWSVAGVICALGTTMRHAGSREAFRRVDHDYPLAVAQHARAHGASAFALTSSFGADARSRNFYLRTKGEVEAAIGDCGYPSFTVVRPGLLGGPRTEFRAGERLGLAILRVLGPLLPRRYRISPADHVARALLEAVVAARPGRRVIGAEELAVGS